jgi:hypothetical protein
MLLADQIALTQHTNRLQAASVAIQSGSKSQQEPNMTFDFGGARFGGDDAVHLMNTVLGALSQIADSAKAALVKGGIEFPTDPVPAGPATPAPNRKGRRVTKAKAAK